MIHARKAAFPKENAHGRVGENSDGLFADEASRWRRAQDAQSPRRVAIVEPASTIATPRHSNSAAGSSTLLMNQDLPHRFTLALSLQAIERGSAIHRSDHIDATAACDAIAAIILSVRIREPFPSRFDSADRRVLILGIEIAYSKTRLTT
jgi:hypothetical protein